MVINKSLTDIVYCKNNGYLYKFIKLNNTNNIDISYGPSSNENIIHWRVSA